MYFLFLIIFLISFFFSSLLSVRIQFTMHTACKTCVHRPCMALVRPTGDSRLQSSSGGSAVTCELDCVGLEHCAPLSLPGPA